MSLTTFILIAVIFFLALVVSIFITRLTDRKNKAALRRLDNEGISKKVMLTWLANWLVIDVDQKRIFLVVNNNRTFGADENKIELRPVSSVTTSVRDLMESKVFKWTEGGASGTAAGLAGGLL
jgi:hypothetical protein